MITFLKKLFGDIFGVMPPRENPASVQNWVNWLNTNHGTGWLPVTGFMSLIQATPGANGTASYNINYGYPLKCFVNTNTGEIRSFDARRFYV